MKHFLLLTFYILTFCTLSLQAQEVEVNGTLTDSYGQGIPGVSVYVKGTNRGTITDITGSYRIMAPYDGILVFSGVGFRTQEVPVSQIYEANSVSNLPEVEPDSSDFDYQKFVNDTINPQKGGVGVLNNKSPRYRLQEPLYNWQKGLPLQKIKYKPRSLISKRGMYVIKNRQPVSNYRQSPFGVNFSNSFKLNMPNRLPDLQNQFAQGRLNTWRGAETNEIFSWGPLLRLLEFDGQAYAYDRNGALTNAGSGNGRAASSYDNYDFFRTAFSLDNLLQVSFNTGGQQFFFKFHQNRQNFIIPQTHQKQSNLALNASHRLGRVNLKWDVNYLDGDGQLPQKGANWQSILSAVMRTPPSFDNADGLKRKEALNNLEVYELNDGTQRSHSPNGSDNPFRLVNTMPDNTDYQRFISNIRLDHTIKAWRFDYQIGYENQHNFNRFGLAEKSVGANLGRLTERTEKLNHLTTRVNVAKTGNYKYRSFLSNWELNIQYLLDFENRDLARKDQNPLASNPILFTTLKERWRNELNLKSKLYFSDNAVILTVGNQSYISSTIDKYSFFLPNLGLLINPMRLLDAYFDPIDNLQLFFSYNQNLNEASLLANNWQYNSLIYSINDYLQYYESSELPFNFGLKPEKRRKTEGGIRFIITRDINVEVSTFRQVTKNLIAPVFTENRFVWQNVAELLNRGWEFSIGYRPYEDYYNDVDFGANLNFTKYEPIVRALNDTYARVPMAGYQEISTNLVEGKPFGSIVGSAFLRNGEGRLIIDNEGFPMVSPELQVIGNPNPDWILNGEGRFRWKDLKFSFILEYRQGGQIWNGTQNVLNYLGRSQLTANQRNISNFVFEGVRQDGSLNTTSVDFANPSQSINQNRWIRYGLSGVAEEAIQKASWFRLSEVKITYSLRNLLKNMKIRADFNVSVFAQNWLLNTAYQGIDPFTSLMGYAQSQGLDLFNTPNLGSIGMQIQVKL